MKPLAALICCVAALLLWHQAGGTVIREWTTTDDFNEGDSISLDKTDDQLQLSSDQADYGILWLPCSSADTILRIDTNYPASPTPTTMPIVAMYRTKRDPSRTAVDSNGNGWVGHRGEASLQRLGVLELDRCVDFNGDGAISTSMRTTEGEGQFPPLLPMWSAAETGDECITHYFTNTSGLSDVRSMAVDKHGNVWIGSYVSKGHMAFQPDPLTKPTSNNERLSGTVNQTAFTCDLVGGYGAVLGSDGTLWSSGALGGSIMRYDTEARQCESSVQLPGSPQYAYGLGIDRNDPNDPEDDVVVATTYNPGSVWSSAVWDKISDAWCPGSRGLAVGRDHHLWVACSTAPGGSVARIAVNASNEYELLATVPNVGAQPTGMAIDGKGKVWVSVLDGNLARRIDPSTNEIDLTVQLPSGCRPYTYGDLTGSLRANPPNTGSWRVVYDSTQENANWDKTALKWIAGTAARQRSDGTIDVSVQSSNDSIAWGNSLVINASGDKLVGLSPGRYLRISFVFNRDSSGASPVLYSVSLQTGCAGRCCNVTTGEVLPEGTVCRRANSACKLDAVCDGTSETCPATSNKPNGTTCKWKPYIIARHSSSNTVPPSASPTDSRPQGHQAMAVPAHEAAAWLTGTPAYDTEYPECGGECVDGSCDLVWRAPGCCYVPIVHTGPHPDNDYPDTNERRYYSGRPYSADDAGGSSDTAANVNNADYWKSREWYCWKPPTY